MECVFTSSRDSGCSKQYYYLQNIAQRRLNNVLAVHQHQQELSKRHVAALISAIIEFICCSL
eukprot:7584-Heterococcus_DN1.PRE.3